MTRDERAYLAMYKPDTYGMELPRKISQALEKRGLVEWVPPKFGATMWAITEKGKKALEERS